MPLSMFPRFQFARRSVGASPLRHAVPARILLATVLLCPGLVRAQQAPPGAVGRVEGMDVSVEGGTPAGAGSATATPGIFVANGSVVTVHSGQARLTLSSGGEIQICGPAKFTLLESGGAITLALNFGRVRIQIPAATTLRIFTPTIVATPLGIGSGLRDITIGLDLNDSLCVLATSGAVRLEHQFTAEILDVPQAGEFFLAGGRLLPVAGSPGGCRCAEMQARAIAPPAPPVPELGLPPQTQTASPTAPPSPPSVAPAVATTSIEPPVEFSVPAHANETHPLPPPTKDAAPPPPPLSIPEYKIIMPPLTFSAASPSPPPDPSSDMVLLVRVARDDPDWEFAGRVEAPHLEETAQRTSAPHRQTKAPKNPQKKKGGFWAALKRIFIGSGT